MKPITNKRIPMPREYVSHYNGELGAVDELAYERGFFAGLAWYGEQLTTIIAERIPDAAKRKT